MMLRIVGFLLLFLSIAHADAVKPADIYVVDGDTIEALGKRIRLVGFDAPELGGHAHSGLERMLAARATSRLRQMIRNSEDIDLQIVDCSCRPGTEGTMACNYKRACGYLTVDGQDVGDVLIPENLAHPLVCWKYSCPRPQSWCPLVPDGRAPDVDG
jgi:endonuclease YncB( thermonuclease family)